MNEMQNTVSYPPSEMERSNGADNTYTNTNSHHHIRQQQPQYNDRFSSSRNLLQKSNSNSNNAAHSIPPRKNMHYRSVTDCEIRTSSSTVNAEDEAAAALLLAAGGRKNENNRSTSLNNNITTAATTNISTTTDNNNSKNKNNTPPASSSLKQKMPPVSSYYNESPKSHCYVSPANSSGSSHSGCNVNNESMISASSSSSSAQYSPPSSHFPTLLHDLLSNSEHAGVALEWLPHGRSWRVLRWEALQANSKLLHKYFPAGMVQNDAAFTWQVHAWGFHEIRSGPDRGSFQHNLFLRGRPELCADMRPQVLLQPSAPLPSSSMKNPMQASLPYSHNIHSVVVETDQSSSHTSIMTTPSDSSTPDQDTRKEFSMSSPGSAPQQNVFRQRMVLSPKRQHHTYDSTVVANNTAFSRSNSANTTDSPWAVSLHRHQSKYPATAAVTSSDNSDTMHRVISHNSSATTSVTAPSSYSHSYPSPQAASSHKPLTVGGTFESLSKLENRDNRVRYIYCPTTNTATSNPSSQAAACTSTNVTYKPTAPPPTVPSSIIVHAPTDHTNGVASGLFNQSSSNNSTNGRDTISTISTAAPTGRASSSGLRSTRGRSRLQRVNGCPTNESNPATTSTAAPPKSKFTVSTRGGTKRRVSSSVILPDMPNGDTNNNTGSSYRHHNSTNPLLLSSVNNIHTNPHNTTVNPHYHHHQTYQQQQPPYPSAPSFPMSAIAVSQRTKRFRTISSGSSSASTLQILQNGNAP